MLERCNSAFVKFNLLQKEAIILRYLHSFLFKRPLFIGNNISLPCTTSFIKFFFFVLVYIDRRHWKVNLFNLRKTSVERITKFLQFFRNISIMIGFRRDSRLDAELFNIFIKNILIKIVELSRPSMWRSWFPGWKRIFFDKYAELSSKIFYQRLRFTTARLHFL